MKAFWDRVLEMRQKGICEVVIIEEEEESSQCEVELFSD
jgi:hypothetical protein